MSAPVGPGPPPPAAAAASGRVPVDGSFGPRTEALTVALQKREHTAPDGIVGPDTRAAYLKLLASEKKTNS